MYPYSLKFRNPKGFLVTMKVESIEEGQRLAVEQGAVCYRISDRGGIAQYEVSESIHNLRSIA